MRVDDVEAGELAAELAELVADFFDLGLSGAQLVEIGARRYVAEHRVKLRLERVEAAPSDSIAFSGRIRAIDCSMRTAMSAKRWSS